MPSERVQRHLERLLDQADEAIKQRDWASVRECARDVLSLDPENGDALTFLAAAERNLSAQPSETALPTGGLPSPTPPAATPAAAIPAAFAAGRYQVLSVLGQGG